MCLQNFMKFHHCLFKLLRKNQNVTEKELQRAITPLELAPSPYFVHLTDVFAKFYEIPTLPFQDIEKPKCRGWMNGRTDGRPDGRMDGQSENSITPPQQTQFAGGYNDHNFLDFNDIILFTLRTMLSRQWTSTVLSD